MVSNQCKLWKPPGIVGVVLLISLYASMGVCQLDPPNPTEPLPPSESPLGVYNDGAVAANCYPCNIVGRDVLMEGGNAVDGALATLFCDGVACLHSMGLGGGFFMTIYNKTTGEVSTINAREHAPAAAFEDMFDGNATLAQKGALAAAVPGELKGYWEVYKRFGSLSWERLITPTIKICEEGLLVNSNLASVIQQKAEDILESESLSEILTDGNGNLLVEGDRLYRLKLAETLKTVILEGGDALYTGSLAESFAADIQAMGGIITAQDMADFQPRWETPVKVDLSGGQTAYTVPAPSSGPLVAFMLNVLDGFIPAADDVTTHQRVAEAMKYAYGMRTHMGDPQFVDIEELLTNMTSKDYALYIRSQIQDGMTFNDPAHYGANTVTANNHGTAHISVIASDGSAVAATSTINLYFGAKVMSTSTGIILNDIMDDFSAPNITNAFGVPPSPENFIFPGKIPLSSMSPVIVVNSEGDAILSVGAAGGTKITSAVAQVTMRNLWFNHTIKEAIDAPRLHHQIYPMELGYEFGTLDNIVQGLESVGHVMDRFRGGSTVCAVARDGDFITANADHRRGAVIGGF